MAGLIKAQDCLCGRGILIHSLAVSNTTARGWAVLRQSAGLHSEASPAGMLPSAQLLWWFHSWLEG